MPYPGQPGNLVGHTAAPGWPGSFTGGTFTSTNPIASYAASLGGGVIPSGTLGSPTVISFIDFDSGTTGVCGYISSTGLSGGAALNHVKFVGCRFGNSNPFAFTSVFCYPNNSDDVTFSYCTFSPSPAVRTTTPSSGAWPSSSVGTGQQYAAASPFAANLIPYIEGTFQHLAIAAPASGVGITVDHCDIWGAGNIPIGIGYIGTTGVNMTGPLAITDNWIHDNRADVPQLWSSAVTYALNDLVAESSGLFIYKSLANGNLNHVQSDIAWWQFYSTNDHTDAILPSNEWNAQNVTINHNTIASIANGNGVAFQPGSASGGNYQPANNYSGATTYAAGNNVNFGGRQYQSKVSSNTGNQPDTHPTQWADMGESAYYNITVTNNYLSGFGYNTQIATSMPNCHNITFTDNVFATDIWWSFAPIKPSDNPSPNGAVNQRTQFTGTNVWRRNRLRLYPGSGSGYASSLAAFDGMFLQPMNFDNTYPADAYSFTDWETPPETLCFLLQEEAA